MSNEETHSNTPQLILILGGARSGKSTFAEQLAERSGRSVAFIATATAGDADMRNRIEQHQASRPPEWQTIEEPLDLAKALRAAASVADVLLLDCVTLWLSNWLMQQGEMSDQATTALSEQYSEKVLQEIETLLNTFSTLDAQKTLMIVSNEVGLGIVPAYAAGRLYRDLLGHVNQRLASSAARVYLMVAGLAVDIKHLHGEAFI